MNPEGTKRKLAAILSADVKGYSRLMEDDEEATVATLTSHKQVMTEVIEKHRGRVVDSPGDNLLAEFASVVDAMRGAVEIQEELRARNSELPDHRRMEFRIGINLGDVIEEDGRLYGDGVNIAARVEGLADPGGICVSGTAYDHLKNKLSLGIEFLGQHEVKNISEPVAVYRLVLEPGAVKTPVSPPKKALASSSKKWAVPAIAAVIIAVGAVALWEFYLHPKSPAVEPASVERMAFPLPEKPSIAVLPFVNMSGDPEQEYLADGISENIIGALAKVPEMFVIARNSTFTYKGNPVKVQQVAEELGVKHVLEGSVQKSGDRIRVTAQLIDAVTGHHLWSEIYNRKLEDLFDLMDDITMEIAIALQVELTVGEQARVRQETHNLEAWGHVVRAYSLFEQITPEGNAKARDLYERAAKLDPAYVTAWTMLGWTHEFRARFGWSDSRDDSLRRAAELAEKALSLDASHPEANTLMGHVHLYRGEYEEAIARGEKSVAFGPNDAEVHALLGMILRFAGRPEEAIPLIKKAMRFNPYYPWWYLNQLGISYRDAGRYEQAVATFQQVIARQDLPKYWQALMFRHLVSCYVPLDQMDDARAAVAKALEARPDDSLELLSKRAATSTFYRDPVPLESYYDALRKAGYPEKSPLPLPDKPSIAVLPFANISGDPEQEYFADGMTDDLITDLSKISGLFVIARNSVFGYKGKSPRVQEVGRELGVRYVLEGSVRRAGDQVRINAQLIDAKTGGHLWAERYDGDLGDVFALHDAIARKVTTALAVALTAGEEERVTGKETDSIAAYDSFLEGREYLLHNTPDVIAKAVACLEKAATLDPDFAQAHGMLTLAYYRVFTRGWQAKLGIDDRAEARARTETLLQKALENPTPAAHWVASHMHGHVHEFEEAIAAGERTLALDPNNADSYFAMAHPLLLVGRPEDAVRSLERAMRLNPHYPAFYVWYLGLAFFQMDQFDKTVDFFRRAFERNPNLARWPLAAALAHLGRTDEAADAIKEYQKLRGWAETPPLVSTTLIYYPYQQPQDAERFATGLVKAGVPGYFRMGEQDRLTGEELQTLVFDRSVSGFAYMREDKQFWITRTKEGVTTRRGGVRGADSGRSWVEGDLLCDQYQNLFAGAKRCGPVFRNPPESGRAQLDEYVTRHEFEVVPWSPVD